MKILTEDTSNQTDAMRFCVWGLKDPPPHIRSSFVIIRSSDAIYAIWLAENTIAFVHWEWTFFRSLFFRFSQKFAYSCIYSSFKHDIRWSIKIASFSWEFHIFLPNLYWQNRFERAICDQDRQMLLRVLSHKIEAWVSVYFFVSWRIF